MASGSPEGPEARRKRPEAKNRGPIVRNRDFYKIIDENDHDLLCHVITDHIMKTGVSYLQNAPSCPRVLAKDRSYLDL